MIRSIFTLFAGCVLIILSTPTWAQEDQSLGCLKTGYSAEEQIKLDALLPEFDALGESAVEEDLVAIVYDAVTRCSETEDWSDKQVEMALMHEFGRISEIAFSNYGPLSGDEIAGINSALAKGNRSEIWATIEKQVETEINGTDEELTNAADKRGEILLGLFAFEVGLADDLKKAELLGVFLSFKAMQRWATREFEAQK
ncbi:MAG: hypothetical protein AAGK17_09915 [Pseudomonadota bacterium]